MKIFYRISDNSYQKFKLPGCSKKLCLDNFLEHFDKTNLTVIADNCQGSTIQHLHNLELNVKVCSYGNAGAIRSAVHMAVDQDCGNVYFVEDDYLHKKNSNQVILEGLEVADYVTLYDHPDKYTKIYNYGEISKVVKTKSSHWRYSISTVMTFATNSRILKEDIDIWDKYTSENHPEDHTIFEELNAKGRKLAISIPGLSYHTDLTFSQMIGELYIEDWAVDIVCQSFKERFDKIGLEFPPLEHVKNTEGWDKIKILTSINNVAKQISR